MKIVIGQGNPGKQYDGTRHNLGFFAIDELASTWGVSFTKKPKFHAEVGEITLKGEKVLLVKPTTFYNETGHAARLIVDFYKCNPKQDVLVIHDDLALPFGTIRTRQKGSSAGNNGIKSLNACLGEDYARIRVGIYSESKERMPDADFVLAHFSKDEKNALGVLQSHIEIFTQDFIKETFSSTKVSVL